MPTKSSVTPNAASPFQADPPSITLSEPVELRFGLLCGKPPVDLAVHYEIQAPAGVWFDTPAGPARTVHVCDAPAGAPTGTVAPCTAGAGCDGMRCVRITGGKREVAFPTRLTGAGSGMVTIRATAARGTAVVIIQVSDFAFAPAAPPVAAGADGGPGAPGADVD